MRTGVGALGSPFGGAEPLSSREHLQSTHHEQGPRWGLVTVFLLQQEPERKNESLNRVFPVNTESHPRFTVVSPIPKKAERTADSVTKTMCNTMCWCCISNK